MKVAISGPTAHPLGTRSQDSLLEPLTQPELTTFKMANPRGGLTSNKGPILVAASYVFDWLVIIVLCVTGYIMHEVSPNKRPFSLTDPNISFPFTENEVVPTSLLVIVISTIPVGIIFIVCFVFVPGPTVPPGTPQSMIWRRKLWELHVGLLGLALSVGSAWFVTNGMKNMFGKPRPDLLSRCQPDVDNIQLHVVGGLTVGDQSGRLVGASICQSTDRPLLDDGFRSFPSGHSSSAAASLIYLSLFLASKFAVTIPFLPPTASLDHSSFSAFPSRLAQSRHSTEMSDYSAAEPMSVKGRSAHSDGTANKAIMAARRQAAAPPIYLLVLALLPFFGSVFIASTRWFDYRHHGFDIIFGYLIGVIASIFSFRYYHLPISAGAGWAWAPRSADRAFWAGVGCYSYATHNSSYARAGDEEEAIEMEDPRRRRGHGGLVSREDTQVEEI